MLFLFIVLPRTPRPTLFPYTTLFRSRPPGGSRTTRCPRTSSVRLFGIDVCSSSSAVRSEEHTSELQSRPHLVCRLLLEKKNTESVCDICSQDVERVVLQFIVDAMIDG